MGNIIAQLFKNAFGDRDYRILMLGLDAAGKTTILYRLKLDENLHTVPTIGFNMEQVPIPGTHCSCLVVREGLLRAIHLCSARPCACMQSRCGTSAVRRSSDTCGSTTTVALMASSVTYFPL